MRRVSAQTRVRFLVAGPTDSLAIQEPVRLAVLPCEGLLDFAGTKNRPQESGTRENPLFGLEAGEGVNLSAFLDDVGKSPFSLKPITRWTDKDGSAWRRPLRGVRCPSF